MKTKPEMAPNARCTLVRLHGACLVSVQLLLVSLFASAGSATVQVVQRFLLAVSKTELHIVML